MKKKVLNKTDRIVGLIDQCLADVGKLWDKPKYLYDLYKELKREVEERERVYQTQCPPQFREEAEKVLCKFKDVLGYLEVLISFDPNVPEKELIWVYKIETFSETDVKNALQWLKDRFIAEDWRRR